MKRSVTAAVLMLLSILATAQQKPVTVNVADGVYILVEAGSFQMGSTDGDEDEKPVHRVTISRSFYISQHEVTQKQWQEMMGTNPSYFKGDNRPVESVSWYDALEYCNLLSRKEELTSAYRISGDQVSWDISANGYRLPTEAEWEYAARGGNQSQSYTFSGSNSAEDVGWYGYNSLGSTHPVGQKRPNELGLYDMSGDVYEWCWDWYSGYSSSLQTDPHGPSGDSSRVVRSGAWFYEAQTLRVSSRHDYTPVSRGSRIGFRLVRTAE